MFRVLAHELRRSQWLTPKPGSWLTVEPSYHPVVHGKNKHCRARENKTSKVPLIFGPERAQATQITFAKNLSSGTTRLDVTRTVLGPRPRHAQSCDAPARPARGESLYIFRSCHRERGTKAPPDFHNLCRGCCRYLMSPLDCQFVEQMIASTCRGNTSKQPTHTAIGRKVAARA